MGLEGRFWAAWARMPQIWHGSCSEWERGAPNAATPGRVVAKLVPEAVSRLTGCCPDAVRIQAGSCRNAWKMLPCPGEMGSMLNLSMLG